MDHGAKKIGLALTSPDLSVITPFKTLACSNFSEYVKNLSAICSEYSVQSFVIGLPLNMDGSEGPRAQSVRHFADNLIKAKDQLRFEPLILFWDERLSSYGAEQTLIEDLNMSKRKRDEIIDQVAAAQILGDVIEAIRAAQAN